MNFVIRRYLKGVSTRRAWLGLAVIPPLLFLLGTAIVPARYSVEQAVTIAKDAPIAVSASPVDFRPLAETAADSSDFFQNAFTLKEIDETLLDWAGTDQVRRMREIGAMLATTMALKVSSDTSAAVIYAGPDQLTGQKLTTYFAERLIKKATEGLHRQAYRPAGPFQNDTHAPPSNATLGASRVQASYQLLTGPRLEAAAWVLLLSLLAVLVLCGVLEWTDPSFKSERQAARYLGIPVLGSFPDLMRLSSRLERKSEE